MMLRLEICSESLLELTFLKVDSWTKGLRAGRAAGPLAWIGGWCWRGRCGRVYHRAMTTLSGEQWALLAVFVGLGLAAFFYALRRMGVL